MRTLLKKEPEKAFYYSLMVGLTLYMLVFACVTHGQTFKHILYRDEADTFMDFFNSLAMAFPDPYVTGSIYPPLASMLYRILSAMVPPLTIQSMVWPDGEFMMSVHGMKLEQSLMFVFMIYFLATTLALAYSLYEMKRGAKYERAFFVFVAMFSTPFLFLFERANILVLALILTLLYLLWRESDSRFVREAALVCLALAAGIKIYPAIFGVLLLKERKFKEFGRLALYCALALVLPAFFFSGFDTLVVFVQNLLADSGDRAFNSTYYRHDFLAAFIHLQIDHAVGREVAALLPWVVGVLAGLSSFVQPTRWKTCLALCCVLAGVPAFSYTYVSAFFIIPLMYYLDDGDKKSVLDRVYFILMAVIMLPKPFGHPLAWDVWLEDATFNTTVECLCVLALALLAIGEGIYRLARLLQKRPRPAAA